MQRVRDSNVKFAHLHHKYDMHDPAKWDELVVYSGDTNIINIFIHTGFETNWTLSNDSKVFLDATPVV